MKVYDVAHDLVNEIRKTEEYKNMITLQKRLDQDSVVKNLLFEFSNEQMQLNSKYMSGEKVSQAEINVVQKKYEQLNEYELAKNFFDTQQKYSNMMSEISKIINGE